MRQKAEGRRQEAGGERRKNVCISILLIFVIN